MRTSIQQFGPFGPCLGVTMTVVEPNDIGPGEGTVLAKTDGSLPPDTDPRLAVESALSSREPAGEMAGVAAATMKASNHSCVFKMARRLRVELAAFKYVAMAPQLPTNGPTTAAQAFPAGLYMKHGPLIRFYRMMMMRR